METNIKDDVIGTHGDMIAEDASMTLASAEEYFEGVGYKFETTGEPDMLSKELHAEVYDDDGKVVGRYKVEFVVTPL